MSVAEEMIVQCLKMSPADFAEFQAKFVHVAAQRREIALKTYEREHAKLRATLGINELEVEAAPTKKKRNISPAEDKYEFPSGVRWTGRGRLPKDVPDHIRRVDGEERKQQLKKYAIQPQPVSSNGSL